MEQLRDMSTGAVTLTLSRLEKALVDEDEGEIRRLARVMSDLHALNKGFRDQYVAASKLILKYRSGSNAQLNREIKRLQLRRLEEEECQSKNSS